MHRASAAVLAIGAVAGAAAACTLLVRVDEEQCTSSADCTARGPAFAGAVCVDNVCVPAAGDGGAEAAPGGPWGCLDTPPLQSDPHELVDVELVAFDVFRPYTLGGTVDGGNDLMLVQGIPEVGVSIVACGPLDPLCASPVAGPAITDDGGITHLSILGDFTGFYLLSRSDSYPTLFYAGRLLAGEPQVTYPTGTLQDTAAAGLGSLLGINVNNDPDAGLGHVFFDVFDCTERHASGISFALPATDAGTQFYLQNAFPNTKQTQTDTSGAGGWLNVPAGNLEVTTTIAASNRLIDTRNIIVRSAAATIVFVRPRVR
jgi:hypothetical protein